MAPVTLKRRAAKKKSRTRAPFPAFIEQCDPTLGEEAPSGAGWLHEIKHDGYRLELHLRDRRARLYSRMAKDWTSQFPPIAEAARALPACEAILDGEALVLNVEGVADLQALRREIGKAKSERLLFYAFDLLYLDGEDLRALPLVKRKSRLKGLLESAPANLVYVDHLETDGPRVFDSACKLGLEGIVSKRKESPYRSGRQEFWIKAKCIKSESFPIIAFVEKLGAKPRRIASLYVGRRDERGRLLYAGKVRTGYTASDLREIRECLQPLILKTSPLDVPMNKPKATWVKPEILAEVQFSNVTEDRLLREAVFKGLRDDLLPPGHQGAERGAVKAPGQAPDFGRREAPCRRVAREYFTAAAGCGRAVEGRTRRVLDAHVAHRAPASRIPAAQAGAPRASHYILSQGTAAADPEGGASIAIAEARGRRGRAAVGGFARRFSRSSRDRGRRIAPVERDRR